MSDIERQMSQERRRNNRNSSAQLLAASLLHFESKNKGAHLIVHTRRGVVDFWPGTGLWITRETKLRRRGVFHLLRWARGPAAHIKPERT